MESPAAKRQNAMELICSKKEDKCKTNAMNNPRNTTHCEQLSSISPLLPTKRITNLMEREEPSMVQIMDSQ
jgi:hypothetical protein